MLSPREGHGKAILKEFRNPTVSLILLSSDAQGRMNQRRILATIALILQRKYGVTLGRNSHSICARVQPYIEE